MNNKVLVEKLRSKYTQNPPEGMTASEIMHMKDDDLLDMDYFLHEDVFGKDDGDRGFLFFNHIPSSDYNALLQQGIRFTLHNA